MGASAFVDATLWFNYFSHFTFLCISLAARCSQMVCDHLHRIVHLLASSDQYFIDAKIGHRSIC
jgi:hypothetical protein